MKLDNYKTMKKSDWQKVAKDFGIEFEETSVVRYLVEKIAEKVGVDDKIVSDNELKKQVAEKINNNDMPIKKENAKKETVKKPVSKKTSKKSVTKKESNKVKSETISESETVDSSDEIGNEEPALTRIEQLRIECECYGVAWTDKFTEENLEQVLNGVKNAGVLPIKPVPTFSKTKENSETSDLNTNQDFEINSSNANEVATAVANAPVNPAFNPLASVKEETPVNGGYQSTNVYLNTYSNIYLNAIRGHWRLMNISEINEMINRDKQTFQYQINHHPQQSNKIEILLIQGSDKVRVPLIESEWIDING